jgi:prolyl-tRNA synthetase
MRGGEKNWGWVKKGVPLRVEVGPRDMAANSVFVARRDRMDAPKQSIARDAFVSDVGALLDDIQTTLFARARAHQHENTRVIDDKAEFYAFFTPKGGAAADAEAQEIHGGFALTHWSGEAEIEAKIKSDLGVTLRCIPLDAGDGPGICPFSGKPSKQRVIWAKSY